MADVTATVITTGGSANSGNSSFNTSAFTPSATKLYLLSVESFLNSGSVNTPTVTGAGLTWVQVNTVLASSNQRITMFRALGTGSNGALTIDHGGQVQILCEWHLVEFNNVVTSGANGADAVVQSATNSATGNDAGITVTLSAFSNIKNAAFGTVFKEDGVQAISPGSGFSTVTGDSTAHTANSEFQASNDTTVDWTWSSNTSKKVAIAVELKAQLIGGLFNFF